MLLADFLGAELAVQAALLLLVKCSMSGENGRMRVSLANSLEGLSWPLNFGLTEPKGLLGGGIARYNLYKTKDSWVALAALEDKYWSSLISELGLPNQAVNKEKLDKIFIQKNSDEWELWARENGLPITAVKQ
jgi:crotonobetainyl-CoA:carnitine CoA-transferase CaiB-like acyl-CoA transferase